MLLRFDVESTLWSSSEFSVPSRTLLSSLLSSSLLLLSSLSQLSVLSSSLDSAEEPFLFLLVSSESSEPSVGSLSSLPLFLSLQLALSSLEAAEEPFLNLQNLPFGPYLRYLFSCEQLCSITISLDFLKTAI